MEIVEKLLDALTFIIILLGIMALIYAGLCLINQKNNKW